ncbi:MAG: hypothetical protein QM817_16610 [Archangium sp.]
MRRSVALALALFSSAALAQSHKGSLGLTVGGGFEALTAVSFNSSTSSERGFRAPLEVGATLGVWDHSELTLSGRLALPAIFTTGVALSFYGGIRKSFGFEQWKTFFNLELAIHALPTFTAGARVGVGLQYDVLPIVGLYAILSGQLGGGTTLRISGDLVVGAQFRTYIF